MVIFCSHCQKDELDNFLQRFFDIPLVKIYFPTVEEVPVPV